MQCAKCGADNKTGAKFCINCGSSMGGFCPNCGTSNTAGAKFCVSCGSQFGVPAVQAAVLSQPVMVVRTGIPGWLWALIGVLVGILVIGGLIISGILPFGAASTEQASPPLQPVSESPEASSVSIVEPEYCPETGGVILYWNAGYDCANETGDPGYRLRYGDGFQDLNTGQFDDQASSIRIPPGWSVRLYESVEQNGASHCFNTSVTNFEDLGNFDNRNLPINDNVTSMQVFRDGTCGQDLAAGAEPAPMPEGVDLGLDAPAGTACTDQAPCACLPQVLKDQINEEGFIDPAVFFDQYIMSFIPEFGGGYIPVIFNPEFERMMESTNLEILIGFEWSIWDSGHTKGKDCTHADIFDGNLTCYIKIPEDAELLHGFDVHIYDETKTGVFLCAFTRAVGEGGMGGGPGDTGQPKDCRDYGCPSGEECVEYKQFGTFGCEPKQQQAQPSGDGQSGGSGSSTTCNAGLDSVSCEAAGGSYHYTFCTNPPCPEWCDCP